MEATDEGDLETVFREHYAGVARTIAAVLKDPARAEELAVEVFLRWSQRPQQAKTAGWLHRTAVRLALDDLRRRNRWERVKGLISFFRAPRTPEEIHFSHDQQGRVSLVLSTMRPRDAELLLLRSEGMSYDELASALSLNPASIGTLLSRAQQFFKKEYTRRYGQDG